MTRSGKETAAGGGTRELPTDSGVRAPINGNPSPTPQPAQSVDLGIGSDTDRRTTHNAIRESLRFTSSASEAATPQRTDPDQLRKFHRQIEEVTRLRQMLHLDTQPESWAQPAPLPPVGWPSPCSSHSLPNVLPLHEKYSLTYIPALSFHISSLDGLASGYKKLRF